MTRVKERKGWSRYLYLLWRFASSRCNSGLQANHSSQQGEGLILGKSDVSIVMETKNLRRIIDGQTTDVCQVTLW